MSGARERELERAVREALDSEQQRLARLLHDTLSQSLNAARIYARVTRDKVRAASPEASDALGELERVIQAAADDLQGLARWLRPPALEETALVPALTELAELAARTLPCELHVPDELIDVDEESLAGLLGLARVALHELVRMPGAQAVEVTLELDDEQVILNLRVACELPRPSARDALLGDRARALGVNLSLRHEPGRGTTATCRVPSRR